MIQDGNLQNFQITAILAIVGQTVGMLNMIYEQTKVDVFFLDWEKPRKILAKDGACSHFICSRSCAHSDNAPPLLQVARRSPPQSAAGER